MGMGLTFICLDSNTPQSFRKVDKNRPKRRYPLVIQQSLRGALMSSDILSLIDFEGTFQANGYFPSKILGTDFTKHQNEFLKLIESVDKDATAVKAGYSQSVTNLISDQFAQYLTRISEPLLQKGYVKKILPFPRIIDINCSYSFYNEEAVKNPTHAHLWHRDLDDIGPQLKIFIPLTDCSELNGQFSCISHKYANFADNLLDSELIDAKISEEYRATDSKFRLTDKTIRSNVPSSLILDFASRIGDVLLIDTNSTYHKGGLVLQRDEYRVMVQVTLGSITHSWYKPKNISEKVVRRVVKLYRKYFGKYTKIYNNRKITVLK